MSDYCARIGKYIAIFIVIYKQFQQSTLYAPTTAINHTQFSQTLYMPTKETYNEGVYWKKK